MGEGGNCDGVCVGSIGVEEGSSTVGVGESTPHAAVKTINKDNVNCLIYTFEKLAQSVIIAPDYTRFHKAFTNQELHVRFMVTFTNYDVLNPL